MEQDDVMIIKVFLGILVILFLIMAVLLITRAPAAEQESIVVITNSFNTYTYSYEDEGRVDRDYYDLDYIKDDRTYLRYGSWSKHKTTQGIFNDIDEYIVYVRNREDVGGYFTVRFYFDDDYGQPDTELMTKYISPHDSAKFSYRDLYQGGHDYSSWRYKVISESARKPYYWE